MTYALITRANTIDTNTQVRLCNKKNLAQLMHMTRIALGQLFSVALTEGRRIFHGKKGRHRPPSRTITIKHYSHHSTVPTIRSFLFISILVSDILSTYLLIYHEELFPIFIRYDGLGTTGTMVFMFYEDNISLGVAITNRKYCCCYFYCIHH